MHLNCLNLPKIKYKFQLRKRGARRKKNPPENRLSKTRPHPPGSVSKTSIDDDGRAVDNSSRTT